MRLTGMQTECLLCVCVCVYSVIQRVEGGGGARERKRPEHCLPSCTIEKSRLEQIDMHTNNISAAPVSICSCTFMPNAMDTCA